MNRLRAGTVLLGLVAYGHLYAQEPCGPGTLFEPYSGVCAEIRDDRDRFLPEVETLGPTLFKEVVPNLDRIRQDAGTTDIASISPGEPPEPGTIVAGITYLDGAFNISSTSRLHTRMFVYPHGVQPDGSLNWLFTPATNNTASAVEVVGIYRSAQGDLGVIGVFGRPCSDAYPCPDGDTGNGWQFFVDMTELTCNISHFVDDGGHAQHILHYANTTDRLDDGNPPLWRSAVYFWNYCDEAWDLSWSHDYREDKSGLSVGWWGPGFEIFGDEMYPSIMELGYEDTLLYHEGTWSELTPDVAGFRDPANLPGRTPWQLFHLFPNRAFGAGNVVNDNDPPEIRSQVPLTVDEDTQVLLTSDMLEVVDADVDTAFHFEPEITIFDGANYTHQGSVVTPEEHFAGNLTVPITVSDGAADSEPFNFLIEVTAINDPPLIEGQRTLTIFERTSLSLTISDITVSDADHDVTSLVFGVDDGANYTRQDFTITPLPGFVGQLDVPITVSDPAGATAEAVLVVNVVPDNVSPDITVIGPLFVTINVNGSYTDAGATASDNVDGDLTHAIVVTGTVNTAVAGTYTISYSVTDVAGNAASVTRTVTVRSPPPPRSSGGGGSLGIVFLFALSMVRWMRFDARPRMQ
jgi:hypothetical protein